MIRFIFGALFLVWAAFPAQASQVDRAAAHSFERWHAIELVRTEPAEKPLLKLAQRTTPCADSCNGMAFSGGNSSGGASPTWSGSGSGTGSAANAACGFSTSCPATTTATITTGTVVAGAYFNNPGSSGSIDGMTINCGTPVSMTPVPGGKTIAAAAQNGISEFYGNVTGGTNCTITLTTATGQLQNVAVVWGTLNNLSSSTPGTACIGQITTFSAPPFQCSSAITVASGGFGIEVFGAQNSTAPTSTNISVDKTVVSGALALGIGHTIVSNTPSFGGANSTFADIAGAPWN